MNTRATLRIFSILMISLFCADGIAQGYKIDVTIKGWQDTTLILGHYFDKKMLVNDTILIDSKGNGTFTGNEKLPGGVYIIYMPDKTYFDLIIDDEQHFTIATTKDNPLQSLVVNGNKQEKAFNDYQRFIFERQTKANVLQEKLKEKSESHPDSATIWRNSLNDLSKEVNSYWDVILSEHQGTFLASFVKAMRDIEVPLFNESNLPDSVIQVKRYQYYKQHYFDNMDLSDDRLLRTPFFYRQARKLFYPNSSAHPRQCCKRSCACN